MARPRILDEKILKKVADRLKKSKISGANVVVSQKASRLGISSEAALVLIAKELGIGTSTYQRKLDHQKQSEIRDVLPTVFSHNHKISNESAGTQSKSSKHAFTQSTSQRSRTKAAIEYLIDDIELRGRCGDLLLASTHFDRPINQATLVLEDRIRTKAALKEKMEGIKLMNAAFNSDLSKTVLQVSTNTDEQDGLASILRGVVLAFRNPTHHQVINTFSRQQALKICGLVDVLLKIVDGSQKIR